MCARCEKCQQGSRVFLLPLQFMGLTRWSRCIPAVSMVGSAITTINAMLFLGPSSLAPSSAHKTQRDMILEEEASYLF